MVVNQRGGCKVRSLPSSSSSTTPTKSKGKEKAATKVVKEKDANKPKKASSTTLDKDAKANGSDKGKSLRGKNKKEELIKKLGGNGIKHVIAKKESFSTKSRSASSAVQTNSKVPSTSSIKKFKSNGDKLKTIRSPAQSPNIRPINMANGPRIQAQRKFAHAGNIYTGTLHLNQPIPSNSPYATPSKLKVTTPLKRSHEGGGNGSVKKVKKPMLSPPPCKRPKTQDFLTFLCVRGTDALPPELNIFNYPQVFDLESHKIPKKKIFAQTVTQTSFGVKESVTIGLASDNQNQSTEIKVNATKVKTSKNGQPVCSTSTETDNTCIAENPTKGIRATASSVLFSKFKKSSQVTKIKPIISPPRSRINEQDARFAMTALKLKYQRLAGNKQNRSALLTKKAKESIILTRSKSRTPFTKLYPKTGKLIPRQLKPVVISPSRNAPSPDIIYGVASCTSAARKRAATKSSSESESASEEDEEEGQSNDPSDAESNESGEESEEGEKTVEITTRSLRNGKELTQPQSKSSISEKKQAAKKNDKSQERRVGTRSARRLTKSPLREIPMYNLKPLHLKRRLGKKSKSNGKNKDKKDSSKKESKSATPKKAEKLVDEKRPSRKTKETAANLMGMLTHGFSTDEDDSDNGRRKDKEDNSDVGSSSSSDTKYLEKHYNAALRREEEKFLKCKKSKVEIKTRKTKREVSSKSAETKKTENKVPERKLRSQKSSKEENRSRSLRNQSLESFRTRSRQGTPTVGDRKMPGAARKSAAITCSRMSRYSSSEEEGKSSEDEEDSEKEESEEEPDTKKKTFKNTKESPRNRRKPAKKIAKLTRSSKHKSQSSEEDESEKDDDEDEESDQEDKDTENDTDNEEDVKPKLTAPLKTGKARKKKTNQANIKRERSSSASSVESNNSFKREISVETEQCKMSPGKSISSRSPSKSPNFKEESSEEDEEEGNEASSSAEEESEEEEEDDVGDEQIPEKVDMSTQVDMDEEEGIIMPPSSSESTSVGTETHSRVEKKQPAPVVKEDSDDDVQEIGVVFASSSTSTSNNNRHSSRRSEKHSNFTSNYSTAATTSSAFHHHLQHPPLSTQPLPAFHLPQQQHATPTLDPLHNNPFSPFLPPPQRQTMQPDFYTPLQLAPPMVHSNHIQLLGGGSLAPSFPVNSPLNTLSIPVSVPFSSHLLPHHPSIGFATGSTYHSTTLQTHIRSVATNLDIPLVRPVMGTEHSSLHFMARGPSIGISNSTPLTRPPMGGVWGQVHMDHTSASPNHFSAFRMPHAGTATHTHTTQHVIHHQQTTTMLGMNSTPVLPVSIIQPQHHHHQQQQNHSQSQQEQPHPYSQNKSQTSQHHKSQSPSKTKHGSNKREQGASSSTSSTSTPSTSTTATSSTNQRPKSPNPPGYHLIKHLPNVSIVPKFDRNSKITTKLPVQEPGTSSSKKDSKTKNGEKEAGEKKKVGRKRKDSAILPQPSSPLLVRKDSNPSTYATKKLPKDTQESDSRTDNEIATSSKKSCATSCGTSPFTSPSKQNTGDKFGKLLKKSDKGKGAASPSPSSSSSSIATENKETGSSPLPKVKKVNKDKEEPTSSKKANSHPPSRTSSPNVQTKAKSNKSNNSNRSGITDAPTFYPTDEDFKDPLKYIQKIQKEAERFGMARIVPPDKFKPECNVDDDMRFAAYNHYIHKMYQRWGPSVSESQAILDKLKQTQVDGTEVAMIGRMEINFSTLYQTVQSFGGLTEVIEKQKWTKVADAMHLPKAHEREKKLDAIYLKYVLPYETLSDGEREKLKKKVEKKWAKRKEKVLKAAENSDASDHEDSMDELDECIVKGKTTPLSSYYRVARDTLNIFFPSEKDQKEYSCDEIEEEYWKIVRERDRPVCVYSGSIDCAGVGWGFPIPKPPDKTKASQPNQEQSQQKAWECWNLKELANNQGSVLRSMGPVMGATVPTLHVAMLFTSYCWYRDPHSLPWIEYLHSGANKIWYSVAAANEHLFRSALNELMPMQCKKKKIWLASDSAMVPPEMLVAKGVPLVRAVQNPGEFLVVFPKAYTSAICTGYLISESVCFAYPSWLQSCVQTFKDIHESKEPPVFPLEKLLFSILQDARVLLNTVQCVLSPTKDIIKEEITLRKKLISLGVKYGGKINESEGGSKRSSTKKTASKEEMEQCYNCNYSLYLSMVKNSKSDSLMCLKHAIEHFGKHKADIKKSTLLFDMDEARLETIFEEANKRCKNLKSKEPSKSKGTKK